jgi:DNA-binding transcriptional MerR regulator
MTASTAALALELGISYRRLDHWVRRGYLRPWNPAPGCGRARAWPANECQVAALMLRLIGAGFEVEAAAEVAREAVAAWGTLGGSACAEVAPGVVLVLCEPARQYELELELERAVESTPPL